MEIAICMPYWNHWDCLKETLASYKKHKYFAVPDFTELSICDDGSAPPLAVSEVLNEIAEDGVQTRLVIIHRDMHDKFQNPCISKNDAINASSAPLIYFTQPDVRNDDPVLFKLRDSIYSRNDVALGYIKQDGRYGARRYSGWHSHPTHRPTCYGASYVMTRDLFERVGGFDEKYSELGYGAEDMDFMLTLKYAGANFKWVDAVATHLYHKKKWSQKEQPSKKQSEYFKGKWGISIADFHKELKGECA